ncbi:MAG: ACT domain-containing protein [Clostridia bacterium]|nr:ACT domain-containing protein [Clostridia bacterium]
MKAVITVIGKDSVGIIAKVAALCAEHSANIEDITQSVLKEYFAMIMLVNIKDLTCDFAAFVDALAKLGTDNGLEIRAMHEDIFDAMHTI